MEREYVFQLTWQGITSSFFFHQSNFWRNDLTSTSGHNWAKKMCSVSLFQRLICSQKYTIGTSETVLIREVSLFQRRPLREVSEGLIDITRMCAIEHAHANTRTTPIIESHTPH